MYVLITAQVLIAKRVDPLWLVGKEGLRDHSLKARWGIAGTTMKVALQQQILFIAFRAVGIFRTFSVLQLVNRIPGLEILSCGTIRRSGGGRAVIVAFHS